MVEGVGMAFTPDERGRQARELADMWSRVSRQHMSGGAGCSCSFGGLMLQASDFELDIVEFLINDARAAGLSGVAPFVDAVAGRGPDRYSLPALIEAIGAADHPATPSDDDLAFALTRLRRTLSSMDVAHTGGRFVCD